MTALLILVHVFVCVALILIVLLQTGKGADMGAAFGGGSSQTLFGASGATTMLGKATTAAAIVFMITSLSLAYISSSRAGRSIMQNQSVPVQKTVPADQLPEPAAGDQSSAGKMPAATANQPAATADTPAPATETPPAQQPAADNAQ